MSRSPASAVSQPWAPGALSALQRRLNAAPTTGQLLARACDEARSMCSFERAIVLTVEGGRLTAAGVDPIEHPESDVLRRLVLARPVALHPGTEEAELLRGGHATGARRSPLREQLGLRRHVAAAIAPEGRAVALLVLEREDGEITAADRSCAELFAHLLGLSLERMVLRTRLRELVDEMRHLTTSAQALMQEAVEAPLSLPANVGHGSVFTTAGQFSGSEDQLRALLTDREREVAALMVQGRSNKQIGDELHLSTDTVKAAVARVARKLGAANRVEAVARYVGLARGAA